MVAVNVKISDDAAASALTGAELVPVVQGLVNRRSTVSGFLMAGLPGSFSTVGASSGVFISANTASPIIFQAINADAGASGAHAEWYHNSQTPAVNDVIYNVDFYGNDAGGAKQKYAQDLVKIADTTAGSEDAIREWYNTIAGANTLVLQVNTLNVRPLLPVDLTAGQIIFPATQNPSANANTFDDYEEGTFIPGMTFGGSATGVTFAIQIGAYTKVGNRSFCDGKITLTSNGSGTGNNLVTGLPFTATASDVAVMVTALTGFSGLTAGVNALVIASSTTMQLRAPTTTGSTVLAETGVTDTASFNFMGHYPT